MESDEGVPRDRCAEHDLAVGPDGLCTLCRRAAAAAADDAKPRTSTTTYLLTGLGVLALACVVGGVAHARRGSPPPADVDAAAAPSASEAPADAEPTEEKPRSVDVRSPPQQLPPSPVASTTADKAAPQPPPRPPQSTQSQLDEALAIEKRIAAESGADAPKPAIRQVVVAPCDPGDPCDQRRPQRTYWGGVGGVRGQRSTSGTNANGNVMPGSQPGMSLPPR
ncbi:MAG TPA: hypothetical protein VGM56_13485 [Byssovorax sp.]|jgi:hypothetical protein